MAVDGMIFRVRCWLVRLQKSQLAAYTGPFVVFMVLLELIRFCRIDNSYLPWWNRFPEHWGYPVQSIVCVLLLWFWRRQYPAFRWRGFGLGLSMGLIGIVIWLTPPFLYHFLKSGEIPVILQWVGVTERIDGFDPGVFNRVTEPGAYFATIVFRFFRLVVVVSLVEEIFWRGFVMRWFSRSGEHWSETPVGHYSPLSFWMTTLLFASVHIGPDFVAAILYGILAGIVTVRTGNLWAVVFMHAVANLCLGTVILFTRWWGLW